MCCDYGVDNSVTRENLSGNEVRTRVGFLCKQVAGSRWRNKGVAEKGVSL